MRNPRKDLVFVTRDGINLVKEKDGNTGWRQKEGQSIREFVIFSTGEGWLSRDERFELRQKKPRTAL